MDHAIHVSMFVSRSVSFLFWTWKAWNASITSPRAFDWSMRSLPYAVGAQCASRALADSTSPFGPQMARCCHNAYRGCNLAAAVSKPCDHLCLLPLGLHGSQAVACPVDMDFFMLHYLLPAPMRKIDSFIPCNACLDLPTVKFKY